MSSKICDSSSNELEEPSRSGGSSRKRACSFLEVIPCKLKAAGKGSGSQVTEEMIKCQTSGSTKWQLNPGEMPSCSVSWGVHGTIILISIVREQYNSYLVTLKGHGGIKTKQSFTERHKRKQWRSCLVGFTQRFFHAWSAAREKVQRLFKRSGSESRAASRACRTQTAPQRRKDHLKSVTLKTKDLTKNGLFV